MTALAPHLTAFLREHLPRERAVSPHTVKTYAKRVYAKLDATDRVGAVVKALKMGLVNV